VYGQPSPPIPAYTLGQKIVFGTGGNAPTFQRSGWSGPEDGFTWTDGSFAEIHGRLPAAPKGYRIVAELNPPFLFHGVPVQPTEVYSGERKVAGWSVAAGGTFEAIVPADATGPGGITTITFRTPMATSPKSVGAGEDGRMLGISFLSITIFAN
jgi:hypothetical protein